MSVQYLKQEQLEQIRGTILDLLGYDPATRSALLGGLPNAYRSLMPGGTAVPAIGLQLDLTRLNTTSRLVDGSVPMRIFLDTAISLTGGQEGTNDLRQAVSDLEATTSGAAPIVAQPLDLEEAIVSQDDMLPVSFLAGGLAAAAGVAKLLVPRYQGGQPLVVNSKPVKYLGTGWLLAQNLLITNHHVVNARESNEGTAPEADLLLQASRTEVLFDYDSHGDRVQGTPSTVVDLVAWDAALDYAVLRIDGDGRSALTVANKAVEQVQREYALAVNVIQHPGGNAKMLGIRNNLVATATATELRYFTDTLGGSSGSPVLDDSWTVVGLHRGSTFVRGVKYQGRDVAYLNVGTQITAVLEKLRATAAGKLPELGI